MNILVLSDLHFHFWNNESAVAYYKKIIHDKILNKEQYDCIVISGDIWEATFVGKKYNPYKFLSDLFEVDCPIICCLGNHEFAYNSCTDVLNWFKSFIDRYNVHILDIENNFLFNNVNFVGNVFWYDNTLLNNPLGIPDKISMNWLDSTIRYFTPSIWNNKCKQQILENLKLDSNITNILVTHTVPHYKMNWFSIYEPNSLYNQYSGCKDFLKDVKNVSWSICGHTHKHMSDTIYNINCINVGNDYFNQYDDIKYYTIKF